MIKRMIAILLVVVTMVGCDASSGLSGAYNMVNCKYSYRSVSGVSLSGMNFSQGFSPTHIAKVTSILSGTATSIPLNFTLNLDVNNPNASAALLHGLQYIISVDGLQFTTGSMNQSLSVASGETKTLPLTIGLDLASLMKGQSKDAAVGVAKNLIGMGSKTSNVSLQIKPTFMIGNTPIASPIYIPVNFTLGGK